MQWSPLYLKSTRSKNSWTSYSHSHHSNHILWQCRDLIHQSNFLFKDETYNHILPFYLISSFQMVVHVSHVNANQVVDALLKPLPKKKKKKTEVLCVRIQPLKTWHDVMIIDLLFINVTLVFLYYLLCSCIILIEHLGLTSLILYMTWIY